MPGATFPYPLYVKWAKAYKKETSISLNYQSIGSGAGIKKIIAGTVNFGATDKPLSEEELQKNNLIQFPAVIEGVVMIVNIEGVTAHIKLDGETIGAIYGKEITKWTDAKIKKLNPDIKLPDSAINVIHRSDGSGTTYIFTSFLQKMSSSWKDKKPDSSIAWPSGIGEKGNAGVAANVKHQLNSIGYVEYAYAKDNNLSHVILFNKDGKQVEPSIDAFQAAANHVDWKTSKSYDLVAQPGAETWPITSPTYILLHKDAKTENNKAVNYAF